jgi:hypothetical protein
VASDFAITARNSPLSSPEACETAGAASSAMITSSFHARAAANSFPTPRMLSARRRL